MTDNLLRTKYIIIDKIQPILFSSGMPHDSFRPLTGEITSAGFYKLSVIDGKIDISCYGESQSLKLRADPGDADIIRVMLGIK